MRFAGLSALVTGAAGGIGGGVARHLAMEGAAVAAVDVADAAGTVDEIEAGGGRAVSLRADVRSAGELERALAEAEAALGRVSLAVAAAGVIRTAPLLELTEEAWDATLAVNLKGTFFLVQTVARALVAAGEAGNIVAVASVAGRGPRPTAADYAASKAGVISVVRSSAVALAPHGIRVNAVCPGVVDTPMTRAIHEERARLSGDDPVGSLAAIVGTIPLGRIETVEEVAAAVSFLLSEDAAYVTGQALNVCGGLEFD